MCEIKPYITKGSKDGNKFGENNYRYSGKSIIQKQNETDLEYRKRIQKETYQYLLANKEAQQKYTTVKDFDENKNKRYLIYLQII